MICCTNFTDISTFILQSCSLIYKKESYFKGQSFAICWSIKWLKDKLNESTWNCILVHLFTFQQAVVKYPTAPECLRLCSVLLLSSGRTCNRLVRCVWFAPRQRRKHRRRGWSGKSALIRQISDRRLPPSGLGLSSVQHKQLQLQLISTSFTSIQQSNHILITHFKNDAIKVSTISKKSNESVNQELWNVWDLLEALLFSLGDVLLLEILSIIKDRNTIKPKLK